MKNRRELKKRMQNIQILTMIRAEFGVQIIYLSVRLLKVKFMKLKHLQAEKFCLRPVIVGDFIKKTFQKYVEDNRIWFDEGGKFQTLTKNFRTVFMTEIFCHN